MASPLAGERFYNFIILNTSRLSIEQKLTRNKIKKEVLPVPVPTANFLFRNTLSLPKTFGKTPETSQIMYYKLLKDEYDSAKKMQEMP